MKNKLILILGHGRSGTSFLARALNINGLYLGEISDLMIPNEKQKPDNPKGHWENWKIYQINRKLLENNVKQFENRQEFTNSYDGFEKDVQHVLNQLDAHPFFGWKDPLMVFTFEMWRPYLPEFKIVGIFRNPLKVAESDKIYHHTSYDVTVKSWNVANEKLLSLLGDKNGFLVDFDCKPKKLLNNVNVISKKIGLKKSNLGKWYSDELKRSDKSYDKNFRLSLKTLDIWEKLKQQTFKSSFFDSFLAFH